MRIQRRRTATTLDAESTAGKAFIGLFLCIGVGLMAWGVYSTHQTWLFRQTAAVAQGEVISLKHQRARGNGSGTYYPIVRWTPPSQAPRSFRGDFGSYPAAYDVGEKVDVLYDPQNPSQARIGGVMGLWMSSVMALLIGAVFTGVACLFLRAPAHGRRQREWLRRHGRPLRAELVGGVEALPPQARKILSFMVGKGWLNAQAAHRNVSTPNIISARWRDTQTGQWHYFKFSGLPEAEQEKVRADGYIEIRIDAKNPARYMAESQLRG
jgi:hypothetical protein